MAGKFEAPRSRRGPVPILILLVIFAALLAAALLLRPKNTPKPLSPETTEAAETAAPVQTEPSLPPQTLAPSETARPQQEAVASATLCAQGDLLMHEPVIRSGKQADGTYDFSTIFQYIAPYVQGYDYAAVNLETTLGGSAYPYQGNPEFNCPDAIADAMVDAGYDMALTANNHASDTYASGIFRTLEQLRDRGLTTLGTMLNQEEKKYEVVEINGIQIGMLCYTYATNELSEGQPSLNYRDFIRQTGVVNYFLESKLERFFTEVEGHIADMRANGAEAIVLYIHWGQEYNTTENALQQGMAQRLCDLGADVIIGGHPHVVQPMELIESTVDPDHRAVCIYSVGNAVSNQMKDADKVFASGHSEDGALFSVTFEKYADGTVRVADTDVLPTWVNRNTNTGERQYNIIPLDTAKEDQWQELYGLTEEQFTAAKESYARTMEILGESLAQCKEGLQQ